ncbi:MAG: hypothetical protein P8Z37_01820 [Acidobacteriota bacterium]
MKSVDLNEGTGRTRVCFSARSIGGDLVVRLYNEQEHIGAVALSEYHPGERRASTSVITRFGHKDDSIACAAAHKICRTLHKSVCAIAGIHLDAITEDEIEQIKVNCDTLINRYIESVVGGQ